MGKRLGHKEAYKRRRQIANKSRFGEGGKADRLGQKLASVPVLGGSAFKPMIGLLSGSVKLYEATKDTDNLDTDAIKGVVKDTIKGAKSTKK